MEFAETIWGPMGIGEEAFNEIADYLEFGPQDAPIILAMSPDLRG